MKRAYILVAVQCSNCKVAGPVNPPLIFFRESEVIAAGSAMHKDSGVICTNPMLMLAYNHAFVSNNVGVQAPKSIIHLPNGSTNGNGVKQTESVEAEAPEALGDSGSEEVSG